MFFKKLFSGRFRKLVLDGDGISLELTGEDLADERNGITGGYTFLIYTHQPRAKAGYISLRLGESPELYYLGHIGYRVHPEFRGHGYAAQACALLDPFFKTLGLHSVVITTDVQNMPSRKTCEKLGCTLERIAPVPKAYRALCAGSEQKCRYILRV